MLLLSACQSSTPTVSDATDKTIITTITPVAPAYAPTEMDPQALLQAAVDHFIGASGYRMNSHEKTSYKGIAADGSVNTVYGEFDAVYDVLFGPEAKVHIQSQFRFSPDFDFTDEEYYVYEQDGAVFRLTPDDEGLSTVEETEGQPIESFIGDVYQTVVQYGNQAKFTTREEDEVVYTLDHPAWYTLQGTVGFADLGLLAMQPDGDELVKDYVEQAYPDVQTVRFILHVSIADQIITKVELDNRDFMLSFWSAYNQALVEQGADPDQLTHYEILPEHGSEYFFSSYDQVSDFDLPN